MAELSIAIADDNRQTLNLLGEILEKEEGIHVVGQADNGEDAYQMIVRTNPDIVLMDVIMPRLDGISVMEKVKNNTQMKNSPSGSHGRAGARISNLPPRLSLLCMVVYIKEEPAMQISMLALLGSRTGEARASVGTAPSNRHIQGMTRLDRCAGQDAEAGRPPIGMRVRMLQRDSSCRIRLLCGCRKTCWQHSYYPNDVRIPWDRFA